MSLWYEEIGPNGDIVLSSRVRLARNLAKYPFPNKADKAAFEKVIEEINNSSALMKKENKIDYTDVNSLSPIDRQQLVEKHIISKEMAAGNAPRGILTNKDESLSVMINEEDHLRIQSLLPGLQHENAYRMCSDFEEKLGERIAYAYNDTFGYLTSCPTNAGTGLRASAMMHLPGLTMSGMMKRILEACGKFGVAVRGVYGENSEAAGQIYQISNQITLGQTEEDIINNMVHIIGQIAEQERAVRAELYKRDPIGFEDGIYRAYGILSSARRISGIEAMELISTLRTGVDMNLIDFPNQETLNRLLIEIQPANISKMSELATDPASRDKYRADLIRKYLTREKIN